MWSSTEFQGLDVRFTAARQHLLGALLTRAFSTLQRGICAVRFSSPQPSDRSTVVGGWVRGRAKPGPTHRTYAQVSREWCAASISRQNNEGRNTELVHLPNPSDHAFLDARRALRVRRASTVSFRRLMENVPARWSRRARSRRVTAAPRRCVLRLHPFQRCAAPPGSCACRNAHKLRLPAAWLVRGRARRRHGELLTSRRQDDTGSGGSGVAAVHRANGASLPRQLQTMMTKTPSPEPTARCTKKGGSKARNRAAIAERRVDGIDALYWVVSQQNTRPFSSLSLVERHHDLFKLLVRHQQLVRQGAHVCKACCHALLLLVLHAIPPQPQVPVEILPRLV